MRCFVLYNIDDFTLRREKSLCRIAATPNHYVRSAFQCSRGVSKGEKEPASIFRNARCFVLDIIDDFTLRREKSLCRIAATPNHYVRSAFQCSREVSKSEKEDANVL